MRDSVPIHLIVFLAYNLAMSLAILLVAAPLGLVIAIVLFVATLQFYVTRDVPRAPSPRSEVLRLRPLSGPVLGWMIVAIPVMLVFIWALSELYISVVPVPPETFNPFGPLLRDPLGRLSIAVLAIGLAPVLEEFFFRGLIQKRLEEKRGPTAGIVLTALLFAVVHVQPWVLPLHFTLGLIFGWVVYVTGSIWSGVLLHAANNVAAVVGLRAGEDVLAQPTVWDVGVDATWWTVLALLVVSGGAAVWVAARLVRVTRTR